MTDVPADALEAAVADLGTLLVRLEKYRLEDSPEAARLRGDIMALGDTARRLHRRGALGGEAAAALLEAAIQARHALELLFAGIRSAPDYQAALAAYEGGDAPRLAALWPRIFAGVEARPVPVAAYHTVDWQRRGRPRAPGDIAATLREQLDQGIAGGGDDLSPGADPDLPVVALTVHWPDGAPLALRFAGRDLPPPVLQRPAVGEVLLPRARLRCRAVVELAHPARDVDEWAGDLRAFHAALVPELEAAGIAVVEGTTPAAPD